MHSCKLGQQLIQHGISHTLRVLVVANDYAAEAILAQVYEAQVPLVLDRLPLSWLRPLNEQARRERHHLPDTAGDRTTKHSEDRDRDGREKKRTPSNGVVTMMVMVMSSPVVWCISGLDTLKLILPGTGAKTSWSSYDTRIHSKQTSAKSMATSARSSRRALFHEAACDRSLGRPTRWLGRRTRSSGKTQTRTLRARCEV